MSNPVKENFNPATAWTVAANCLERNLGSFHDQLSPETMKLVTGHIEEVIIPSLRKWAAIIQRNQSKKSSTTKSLRKTLASRR